MDKRNQINTTKREKTEFSEGTSRKNTKDIEKLKDLLKKKETDK